MSIKCAICDTYYESIHYTKTSHLDRYGKIVYEPAYFATPYFNKQLIENLHFCSAKHSLEWHEANIEKNLKAN